jgi:hypothetical protein
MPATPVNPSRRSVARAGAWSAPVLAVAAAAPVAAASPDPAVGGVSATKGSKSVTLSMTVTNADPNSTLTVTAITGGGTGASTWQLPVSAAIGANGAVAIVPRNNNAGGTYTASYVINPGGHTGTFVFTV